MVTLKNNSFSKTIGAVVAGTFLMATNFAMANEQDDKIQQCLLDKLNQATGTELVSQLRAECEVEVKGPESVKGLVTQRIYQEGKTKFNPYVITPHKKNYIIPVTFTDNINREVYQGTKKDWSTEIESAEAKYQLSIKVPLSYGDMFTEGDEIFFGMTLQSWWQIYSSGISKPFRETNYQPEFFYLAPLSWKPFGANTGYAIGIEHQSNGRSTEISRSWNRAYVNFLFEKGDFAFSIKPYYRFDEDKKEYEGDPDGDDNPDIMDYMGYFDAAMVYKYDELEFTMLIRRNFATSKGAAELGFTFPLWGRLRGYAQYYTGYGESLIDYNHKQNRIGIGLALTDSL